MSWILYTVFPIFLCHTKSKEFIGEWWNFSLEIVIQFDFPMSIICLSTVDSKTDHRYIDTLFFPFLVTFMAP